MLMTRLDLVLRLEWPELDHDRTHNDVVGDWIVVQSRQDIFRPVGLPVDDVLDALIALGVPDLNDFVRAKTDQMVPLLVDVQVAHRSVVSVQVGELLQRVGLPEDNVALFTAAGDLLVLLGVDEAVDTLLMQVERALLTIVEILQLVHMNEAVERAG